MTKRTRIRLTYPELLMDKDTRQMDEICQQNTFELQAHQKFMQKWMDKHSTDWASFLIYHQIGSGKTLTSIMMAEEWIAKQEGKARSVKVILPARLKTNFTDELAQYVARYQDIAIEGTNNGLTKKQIQTEVNKAIEASYDVMSIERWRLEASKQSDLKAWIREYTKNRLFIFDEIHNLINSSYNDDKEKEFFETNKFLPRMRNTQSFLLKMFVIHAHPTCKMLFLTATPIFDNKLQFLELLRIMNPANLMSKSLTELKSGYLVLDKFIGLLRGRVSFFPGVSPNAYPTFDYKYHNIPFTPFQDQFTKEVQDMKSVGFDDEDKESFLSKQRQIALNAMSYMPKNRRNEADLVEYAPKIVDCVKSIEKLKSGKHLVFSNFVENGLSVTERLLKEKGWTRWSPAASFSSSAKVATVTSPFKTYAIWDGNIKDDEKQLLKKVVNSKDNVDGRIIRVVLGSPSIKEGVSFKHMQHMHILDPVWNPSAKRQVEGRAIRFCSHVDIPLNHVSLKRHVTIHIYKSIPLKNGQVLQTCDEKIYDEIIPQKEHDLKILESALQNVSVDYFLFRRLYKDKDPLKSTEYARSTEISPVEVEKEFNFKKMVKNDKNKKLYCPKQRRPNSADKCPLGYERRLNKHDEPCCYKERKKTTKKSSSKKT